MSHSIRVKSGWGQVTQMRLQWIYRKRHHGIFSWENASRITQEQQERETKGCSGLNIERGHSFKFHESRGCFLELWNSLDVQYELNLSCSRQQFITWHIFSTCDTKHCAFSCALLLWELLICIWLIWRHYFRLKKKIGSSNNCRVGRWIFGSSCSHVKDHLCKTLNLK